MANPIRVNQSDQSKTGAFLGRRTRTEEGDAAKRSARSRWIKAIQAKRRFRGSLPPLLPLSGGRERSGLNEENRKAGKEAFPLPPFFIPKLRSPVPLVV
jgi:hypothetical protein